MNMNYCTLICDAGATKSAWALIFTNSNGQQEKIIRHTGGINAATNTTEQIESAIADALKYYESTMHPQIDNVRFYGAGCAGVYIERMRDILAQYLPNACLEVASDMLGAARAACRSDKGIVCIMGTGSNSCYYDGDKIVDNVPPLGWILGDEGSGVSLGKRLINGVYKRTLTQETRQLFEAELGLTLPQIIERVYRQPGANVWIASLVPFMSKHIDRQDIRQLVETEFRSFVDNNLCNYPSDIPVHFIGSIAYVFREQLVNVVQQSGYTIGRFIKSPIDALIND